MKSGHQTRDIPFNRSDRRIPRRVGVQTQHGEITKNPPPIHRTVVTFSNDAAIKWSARSGNYGEAYLFVSAASKRNGKLDWAGAIDVPASPETAFQMLGVFC